MAGETDPKKPPQGPATAVPITFGTEMTVPAGGSATINFKVGDQDLILSRIGASAQGPLVLHIRIGNTPDPGAPTIEVPGGTFQEYVEQELPGHLAAMVGEDREAWAEKNRALQQAAADGDDETFFEFLSRDPRQLQSELTLRRVLTWRTEIDQYNQAFRVKASRLLIPGDAAEQARDRMELARPERATW